MASALLAMAVLSPASASQGAGGTPWDVDDPAGDANSVSFFLETPDTTPISDQRADIRRVWMETTYDTVQERTEAGKLVAIRHVPRSLRISVQTTAPARPATGPTLWFVLSTRLGGCYPAFGFKIRGPISTNEQEIPEITNYPPDGVTIGNCYPEDITHPGFSLTFDGNVARMDFPFAALAQSAGGAEFTLGAELIAGPHRPMFLRTFNRGGGGDVLFGVVDATQALEGSYVIGSDVPPDIDCLATPNDPACVAASGSS